ncbi:Fumarate and nitrate reduction regulatory protein [compost metagenome]
MSVPASTMISTFFERYTQSQYSKGQVLLLQGEEADHIYYLLEGYVKVYTISYRGDEVILHVYRPLDFFPMSHAISPVQNKYIYEADSDIVVRRAPLEAVKTLIKEQPSIALELLKRSYDYINDFLDRQSLLMAGSARSKLIYELIIQCQRFSSKDRNNRYTLDIHEGELAARIGLSRETINREVKKLKKEMLLILNHRTIIIPSIDNLKQKLAQSI